jgi:hypothetical protein
MERRKDGEKRLKLSGPRRWTDEGNQFCHPVVRAGPKRLQLWF